MFDLLAFERVQHILFRVEDLGRSSENQTFFAGDFAHRPAWCEIALENTNMPRLFNRTLNRLNNVLIFRESGQIAQIFGQGLARHRQAVTMQQSFVQEVLHHCRGAADVMQIFHHVLAAGLEVGHIRHAVTHRLEVVDGEDHINSARHGDQMQHGVGRAAQRHDHNHGVFERLTGHNIARFDILLQQGAHRLSSPETLVELAGVGGRRRGAERQAHAQRFDG